jgi:hypothetical protein
MNNVLDFSASVDLELNTKKGMTVLREASGPEYLSFLKKVGEEGRETEKIYNDYISYFVSLGGEVEKLESLTLPQLIEVAKYVNGGNDLKK